MSLLASPTPSHVCGTQPSVSPLFALGCLVDLSLRNNRLRWTPRQLLHCASLERLDVSRNQLVTLPGELGQLRSLVSLDVSDNEVCSTTVPLPRCHLLRSCRRRRLTPRSVNTTLPCS